MNQKMEILRLQPQNDITTQSPRGEGVPFIPTAELWGILAPFYKSL